MHSLVRIVMTAVILATAVALGGCEDTKLLEFFDTKKKLPGERRDVFPGGVPGVQQGVPPELMKGYQEPAEAAPPPQGRTRTAPSRGTDLARHLAADLRRRRLLSAAHLRRHPCARASRLAAGGRDLLCRRAAARGRRLRLLRDLRRDDAQVHAVLRRGRQRAAAAVLRRNGALDVLAVACALRRHSRAGQAAARFVRRRIRSRL